MPISGLILSLSANETLAAQAVATVSERPEFMPGERNARWLPVAMEARDDAESRDLHDWLNALPGVDFVDVVYVNFDEDVATATPTGFGLRRQSGSGDGAFERAESGRTEAASGACESGVALRFPPQSKTLVSQTAISDSDPRPPLSFENSSKPI